MTRVEPSTGTCPQCGQLIIDAEQYGGHAIRLDAKPVPTGEYRAYYSTRGYWAAVQVTPDETSDVFRGMRRRPHDCKPPDVQLDFSAEPAPAGVSLPSTEELMCIPPPDTASP